MDTHISRVQQRAKPHVVTQWQEKESRSQQVSKFHKSSSSCLRPDLQLISQQMPSRIHQSPSLRVLAPFPINKWENGWTRHTRDYSEPETPASSVGSIFELKSEDNVESSNSSNYSYYIAELGDTSLPTPPKTSLRPHGYANTMPRRTRPPPMEIEPRYPVKPLQASPAIMEFRTAQMTSRAVIKVIDETIAAIEDTNRQLLSRALAAEEVAQMMQERNLELEFKIKHYSQPQYRPKTAPAQQSRPRQRSAITPISAFNDSMLQAPHSQRQTKSQLPPPRNQDFTPSIPFSRPIDLDLDLAPTSQYNSAHQSLNIHPSTAPHSPHRTPFQSSCPLYTSSHIPPNNTHEDRQQTYLQPQSQPQHLHTLHISPIIPESVSRHTVTYAGAPLSPPAHAEIISLAEARRRAKPLPPLGPMSPSVLRGVVEIGDTRTRSHNEVQGRNGALGVEKRKKGLSGLLSRRRKDECFF